MLDLNTLLMIFALIIFAFMTGFWVCKWNDEVETDPKPGNTPND